MGWIGWVHCEKSRHDFVARSFALIALVQPILHRVSWSYEMIPNAPKHYTMHQNMSLGSNGARCVRCENSQRDFVARTFALIAPVHYVLHQVSSSYEKRSQMHPNTIQRTKHMSLGSYGVDWVRS